MLDVGWLPVSGPRDGCEGERLTADLKNHLELYVRAVLSTPEADDSDVGAALLQSGVSERRAFELILWVPFAFGRTLLRGPGLVLPDHFSIINSEGTRVGRGAFRDQPVYVAALNLPDELRRTGYSAEDFMAIAGRSAEVKAVNSALYAGSQLADLELEEPAVFLPWFEPNAVDSRRPWWRVW